MEQHARAALEALLQPPAAAGAEQEAQGEGAAGEWTEGEAKRWVQSGQGGSEEVGGSMAL